MISRVLVVVPVTFLFVVLAAGASPAGAQTAFEPPRLPDGRPDLQGVWDFRTLTPLERPEDMAEKAVLTDEEASEIESQAAAQNIQIFQTTDHVVIFHEMVHDARIVPLDGRDHLPAGIRQWMGDSRGHWDGDTLVIESTNFTAKTASFNPSIAQAAGDGTTLHLTERFRLAADDTLDYEYTVDDLTTFASPFTVLLPMQRGELVFEYACHEGNYGLYNMLAGARAKEAEAQQ